MKKKIIIFGAIVLCITMITGSANVSTVKNDIGNNYVKVVKMNATPITEQTDNINVLEPIPITNNLNGRLGADIQVTYDYVNEFNPAVGIDLYSEYLLAYTYELDPSTHDIPWTFSVDGGNTWDPGVYYDITGVESHPAISYCGSDKKFAGTIQGDPVDGNGAIQWTFICYDPTDSNTYDMSSIAWGSSYPYSDRYTPDVGGYTLADKPWWYGVISVVGTRASPGSVEMPIFNYADYEAEGSGWSSYFGEYPGCEHTAIDVDLSNGYFYAVFDYLEGSDWDLLLMRGDCNGDGGSPNEHLLWFTSVILGDVENTTYPAIGASDDNVIILAQTDEAGTQDIVCYYSSDGGENWLKSFVADDAINDELYPTIVSYGLEATCTFIMDDDLYYSKTVDGGESWSTPTVVNDESGSVESDFRNVDITTDGTVVWTDFRNGNLDIYLDNVGAPAPPQPPGVTVITGPAQGKPKTTLYYDFSAVHPDGTDIAEYIINWGDGTGDETITGPFASGVAQTANHTWVKGDYTITAKAKDINGLYGPTGSLAISIPRGRTIDNLFLQQLYQFAQRFQILRYLIKL